MDFNDRTTDEQELRERLVCPRFELILVHNPLSRSESGNVWVHAIARIPDAARGLAKDARNPTLKSDNLLDIIHCIYYSM